MVSREQISAAIVKLREAMGMSQVTFAVHVLKKGYSTLQRWEQSAVPPASELVKLVHVAREHGQADIAEVLKQAAIDTVPSELVELIREKDPDGRGKTEEAGGKSAGNQRKLRAG